MGPFCSLAGGVDTPGLKGPSVRVPVCVVRARPWEDAMLGWTTVAWVVAPYRPHASSEHRQRTLWLPWLRPDPTGGLAARTQILGTRSGPGRDIRTVPGGSSAGTVLPFRLLRRGFDPVAAPRTGGMRRHAFGAGASACGEATGPDSAFGIRAVGPTR